LANVPPEEAVLHGSELLARELRRAERQSNAEIIVLEINRRKR
jgi:hypothetical protein